MSAPFVAQLRVGREPLVLGADGAARITVRVEMPELWDVIRVDLPTETPVLELKQRALSTMQPRAGASDQYVLKLHGFEVLDENATVSQAGGVNGSIFLLTNRRRRPVRA